MKKTIRDILYAYYAVYVVAILSALTGYYILQNGFNINPQSQSGVVISSLLIIIIIGSVPLSLFLFNKYMKKLALLDEETLKFKKYRKAAIIRIIVMGSGLALGIIFFYIMKSQSMIFCAGIAAIGLFFCKPAEGKIISDLKLDGFSE